MLIYLSDVEDSNLFGGETFFPCVTPPGAQQEESTTRLCEFLHDVFDKNHHHVVPQTAFSDPKLLAMDKNKT